MDDSVDEVKKSEVSSSDVVSVNKSDQGSALSHNQDDCWSDHP